MITGYLEVYDGPEESARLATLEALKHTIQHAWPRYHISTKQHVSTFRVVSYCPPKKHTLSLLWSNGSGHRCRTGPTQEIHGCLVTQDPNGAWQGSRVRALLSEIVSYPLMSDWPLTLNDGAARTCRGKKPTSISTDSPCDSVMGLEKQALI